MAPRRTSKPAVKSSGKTAPKRISKATSRKVAQVASKTRLSDLLSPRSADSPYLSKNRKPNPRSSNSNSSKNSKVPTKTADTSQERVSIGSASNPILLSNPSSYASRTRGRVTLSAASIFAASAGADDEDDYYGMPDPHAKGYEPPDHAATFSANSLARLTWGCSSAAPIVALEKEHHKSLAVVRARRRGGKNANDMFTYGKRGAPASRAVVPNNYGINPLKCYLLTRLPREIRWKIYEHLLIHKKPILVHHDWSFVHIKPSICNNFLNIGNREIFDEVANFVYRENVFRALVKKNQQVREVYNGCSIRRRWLPLFKNVVLECPKDNFGLEWLKTVAESINLLVDFGAILDSLTLDLQPRRVGITQTLLGTEIAPVTFADFLFTGPVMVAPPSDVMLALSTLRVKTFNVVIRLQGKKRALITIDMSGLPVNEITDGWLSDDPINIEVRMERMVELSAELRGVKARFEAVVDDAETAVKEGKARWLMEGEQLACGGGMKLVEVVEAEHGGQ